MHSQISIRIKQLDVLRGIAILLVLGRHFAYFEVYSGFGAEFFKLWKKIGWIGVDLFFVLSGFLVSGLLFKEYQRSGKINLSVFFIRRGFKIYPAYYFLHFVTVIIYATVFNYLIPIKYLWSQTFFLQNYSYLLWGHTWSIAVEEHFYFLLGGIAYLCLKKKSRDPFRILVGGFVIVALGCLVFRVVNYILNREVGFEVHRDLYPTHLRIDSLI